MPKFYITFGQSHAHRVNGNTFDCDSLCEIEAKTAGEAHDRAMDIFGGVFHQCFDENEMREALSFFPRGIIKLEN